MWKNIVEWGRPQMTIWRNMLDNYGCIHTLRLRNTHCFATATVVARTHLRVTFIRTLPLLFCVIFSSYLFDRQYLRIRTNIQRRLLIQFANIAVQLLGTAPRLESSIWVFCLIILMLFTLIFLLSYPNLYFLHHMDFFMSQHPPSGPVPPSLSRLHVHTDGWWAWQHITLTR